MIKAVAKNLQKGNKFGSISMELLHLTGIIKKEKKKKKGYAYNKVVDMQTGVHIKENVCIDASKAITCTCDN